MCSEEILQSWRSNVRSTSKCSKVDCLCHWGTIHHIFWNKKYFWIHVVPQIGAIVIVALPLLLYFLVVVTNESSIFRSFEGFLIFAIICWTVGLIAFAYLHYMWVKPSRHLLLGLQQVVNHPSEILRQACKSCHSQLSALEFLPWTLTAFIHSVPFGWLYYTNTYTSDYDDQSNSYRQILRTDLTCWHWIFGAMCWALILTPQFIVLAAQQRVRRFDLQQDSVHFYIWGRWCAL